MLLRPLYGVSGRLVDVGRCDVEPLAEAAIIGQVISDLAGAESHVQLSIHWLSPVQHAHQNSHAPRAMNAATNTIVTIRASSK